MILDHLEVIEPPDDRWLTRLRSGHFVWVVKDKRYAQIEWAWEPPDPGCVSGYLGIKYCWRNESNWGFEHSQKWYIYPDGTGFDGKPLLLPLEGNCPDEPTPLSEPWVRQTERTINNLVHRIVQLEAKVRTLETEQWQWQ